MATYDDPAIIRLTGSSEPTGEVPAFEPVTSEPASRACAAGLEGGEDPVFAVIETHRRAFDAWMSTAPKGSGRDLPAEGLECDAENTALEAVIGAKPTTVPGLRAWIDYLDEIDGDLYVATRALPFLAAAGRNILWSTRPRVGPEHDADLIALESEFNRLRPLMAKAYQEMCRIEAERDNSLPAVPPGLICDPNFPLGDDVESRSQATGDGLGTRFYPAKAVEHLRRFPRSKVVFDRWLEPYNGVDHVGKRVPDDEAQARVPGVIAAFEEWEEACRRHSAEIGYDAAALRHKDLAGQVDRRFDEICGSTPVSLTGLSAQARVARLHRNGERLDDLVADRLDEFARAAASPAMSGRLIDDPDCQIVADFDAWVAAVRFADNAKAAGKAATVIDDLRRKARELRAEVVFSRALTARGMMLKAMTCNGPDELAHLLDDDIEKDRVTLDTIARSVTLDLVLTAGVTPQEWPVGLASGSALQAAPPDRRALEAYSTWLFYERRMLLIELYGDQTAREMERCRHEDNRGGDMHFPREGDARDVPRPSTRAAAWLDMVGVDWRSDEAKEWHGTAPHPLDIVGKVA